MSDDLTAHAGALREEVPALRLEVKQLRERTERAEKVSMHAVGAVACLLLLLGAVAWNVFQQHQTADRLDSLVQRSLCPVYALVVGGYDPSTRPLNPDGSYPGSAREKYDRNNEVMAGAYREMQCIGLVPPRTEN